MYPMSFKKNFIMYVFLSLTGPLCFYLLPEPSRLNVPELLTNTGSASESV